MLMNDHARPRYAPSPRTVSFTGNIRPEDYTELSPQFYADLRGNVEALNALPFLSDTGPIVVRAYKDEVLASASFDPHVRGMSNGRAGTTRKSPARTPRTSAIPNTPQRRGFRLFSWVAVLHGRELGGEFWQDVNRHADLNELEEKALGEKRVHFII